MSRVGNFFVLLRERMWIVPILISCVALALAYFVIQFGAPILAPKVAEGELRWLFSGDASTARGLLSSLLSGLLTMTSLIVSVTFVILTLAANQLGPRLISTFLADRQIQMVFGLFLGTILYVLVVLGSLDEAQGSTGVPRLAVTVGGVLTILCLFALMFYVDKVARSIIADNVVERVSRHLLKAIRDSLPEDSNSGERSEHTIALPQAQTIELGASGYVQVVAYDELVSLARRIGAVLQVNVRAGHFVLSQGEHVAVHAGRPLDETDADAIRSAFVIGAERSPAQDLEYDLRRLVEIALRALSTGINDPFTAIAVIDHLGVALEEICRRAPPPSILRDEVGEVRVVADRSDAAGLVHAAFDPIRQAGGGIPAVLIRMADVLGRLAPSLNGEPQRNALLAQAGKLAETARDAHFTPSDRVSVLSRIEKAEAAIKALRDQISRLRSAG
jgi:uncharacterized membrane protein